MQASAQGNRRALRVDLPGVETEAQLWDRHPSLRPQREGLVRGSAWIALGIIIAIWYILTDVLGVPKYILPRPHVILREIFDSRLLILKHLWVTVFESLLGLVLATVLGVFCAFLIVWSPRLGRALLPVLTFSQTTPKVALAPLFLFWFGFGYLPKIIISFLIAFFPIVIATSTGLNSAEREMLELIHSLSNRTRHVFLKVRFPSALPFFFSGLKVSATLAVIGALVGEFVGSDSGMAYLILVANSDVNAPLLFAILVVLAILGYLMFVLVGVAERVLMPWHASVKSQGVKGDYTF